MPYYNFTTLIANLCDHLSIPQTETPSGAKIIFNTEEFLLSLYYNDAEDSIVISVRVEILEDQETPRGELYENILKRNFLNNKSDRVVIGMDEDNQPVLLLSLPAEENSIGWLLGRINQVRREAGALKGPSQRVNMEG
jgi:hypothetical protein